HRFPGGAAGAEIPFAILQSWKRPLKRLFRARPASVFSGQRVFTIPPVRLESAAAAVSLEDTARAVRSLNGSSLSPEVATGKGVTVAVLDTGINPVTPALDRALKERVTFVPGETDPDDRRGHGTAVGACVVAVARDVQLVSVKVL